MEGVSAFRTAARRDRLVDAHPCGSKGHRPETTLLVTTGDGCSGTSSIPSTEKLTQTKHTPHSLKRPASRQGLGCRGSGFRGLGFTWSFMGSYKWVVL